MTPLYPVDVVAMAIMNNGTSECRNGVEQPERKRLLAYNAFLGITMRLCGLKMAMAAGDVRFTELGIN